MIIKSMYSNCKSSIKIVEKTEHFKLNRGFVVQHCSIFTSMSWNKLLYRPCTQLQQTEVNDDLVLLSPSEQGLQQLFHQLDQYRQSWALAASHKKTKNYDLPK